jgi:hypothetical protein
MSFNKGDIVRIKSLTDVDTKEPDTDEVGLIGKTATVVDPYLCDYYDCIIQLNEPLGELGNLLRGYGEPPMLAFLNCDLEVIK